MSLIVHKLRAAAPWQKAGHSASLKSAPLFWKTAGWLPAVPFAQSLVLQAADHTCCLQVLRLGGQRHAARPRNHAVQQRQQLQVHFFPHALVAPECSFSNKL